LTTSLEYFYLGKAAVTDMTLSFCLMVALLSFIEKAIYVVLSFHGVGGGDQRTGWPVFRRRDCICLPVDNESVE